MILAKITLISLVMALALVGGTATVGAKDMQWVKMADGFDFPVGKPDADGYYKSRGFRPHGHLGEDWNGKGGGNTDLGLPVYNIGHGIVTFARDARMGWGNVVIVRHVFVDTDGKTKAVDSLYGHLHEVKVREGQTVRRGDQLGTIGNNRGMYWAHLHFEIRKNLQMGMQRSKFTGDFSNFYDPSDFIVARRRCQTPKSKVKVDVDTYNDDRKFFPPHRGLPPIGVSVSERLESDEDYESEDSGSRRSQPRRRGGRLFQRSDDYFY
jgi:hypothetical protein